MGKIENSRTLKVSGINKHFGRINSKEILKPKNRKGSFVEVDGDLIKMSQEGKFDFIGHGCNCFATMGAGIALPIGLMYPQAKQADEDSYLSPHMRLGNYTVGVTTIKPKNKISGVLKIVNFYSQYHGGKNFDKEALIISLRKFATAQREMCLRMPAMRDKYRMGLPIIGCGIAGGNWNTVRKIIMKELKEFDVTIVHFNG
jgi:O-acetyl-ADP-ribose deacetylase (regulator of RNase III)